MKKILLQFYITLMLLCASQVSYTQAYTPFPDSNAVWSVSYISGQFYTCHYKLFGDTIINSITYRKLYYNNGLIDTVIDIISPNTTYYGALRQDSTEKKVYFFPANPNHCLNEFVLCDFNLDVGDSLNIPLTNTFYITAKCTYIGYSFVGSQLRKILTIQYNGLSSNNTNWIEGIGDNMGLFAYMNGPNYTTILLCLTNNDTIIYQYDTFMVFPFFPPFTDSTIFSICSYRGIYYPIDVNEENNEIQEVIIYPNPLSVKTNVFIPDSISLNSLMIEIYDIRGRKIRNFHDINSHQLTLYREDFRDAGVYFLRIKNNKYFETIKLIVQ